MPPHLVLPIAEISQVGEARRIAARLAEEAGFRETEKGKVAIVATELATNLVHHARDGRILLRSIVTEAESVIEILSLDRHPGRSNFASCLADGYSTAGTPGNGLGAVKRLSKTFDYFSAPDAGTVVLAHIGSQESRHAKTSKPRFEWAALSIAAPGETVCGDAYRVEEDNGELKLIVADGLGHGPGAAEAAEKTCEVFGRLSPFSPKSMIEQAHRSLSGTRGAALAALAASGEREDLDFAGIGNISGSLQSLAGSRGLMSHNGTVGAQMRSVQQLKYQWPKDTILVLHSDGIKTRWNLTGFPGLIHCHPSVIAAVLLRDYCRGNDDSSIVVVRRTSV